MKLLKNLFQRFQRDEGSDTMPGNPNILKGNLDADGDAAAKDQTGGLRLMTIFIVVLALHVMLIGGISVYHLFKGDGSDVAAKSDEMTPTSVAASGSKSPALLGENELDADLMAESPLVPESGAALARLAPNEAEGIMPPPIVEKATPSTAKASPKRGDHSKEVTTEPSANEPTVVTNAPVVAKTAEPSPESKPLSSHQVRPGDNLGKIAKLYGTTVSELKRLNGLKTDVIRVGQDLKVPGSSKSETVSIAAAPAKPAVAKPVSAAPAAPRATTVSYTVKAGDTLSAIAKRHNTTAAAIMVKNNIKDANKLRVGSVLTIPVKASENQEKPAIRQTASTSSDLVMNR